MDWTYVRLGAHLLLIVWAVTAAYMLFLARGRTVEVVHVPIAIAGLALLTLWLLGLSASLKSLEIVPRTVLIPLLASLELGAGVMAWAWLVPMYRTSFRLRTNIRTIVFG